MKRYFFTPSGDIVRKDYQFSGNCALKYDDVVDRSTFSIDSDRDNARKAMLNGSSTVGAFDGDNVPTDLEVQIRSGKFDKAEISKIQRIEKQKFLESKDKIESERSVEKLERINNARQEHLDKITGFSGQPEKQ